LRDLVSEPRVVPDEIAQEFMQACIENVLDRADLEQGPRIRIPFVAGVARAVLFGEQVEVFA
jgi:hypothetical protein